MLNFRKSLTRKKHKPRKMHNKKHTTHKMHNKKHTTRKMHNKKNTTRKIYNMMGGAQVKHAPGNDQDNWFIRIVDECLKEFWLSDPIWSIMTRDMRVQEGIPAFNEIENTYKRESNIGTRVWMNRDARTRPKIGKGAIIENASLVTGTTGNKKTERNLGGLWYIPSNLNPFSRSIYTTTPLWLKSGTVWNTFVDEPRKYGMSKMHIHFYSAYRKVNKTNSYGERIAHWGHGGNSAIRSPFKGKYSEQESRDSNNYGSATFDQNVMISNIVEIARWATDEGFDTNLALCIIEKIIDLFNMNSVKNYRFKGKSINDAITELTDRGASSSSHSTQDINYLDIFHYTITAIRDANFSEFQKLFPDDVRAVSNESDAMKLQQSINRTFNLCLVIGMNCDLPENFTLEEFYNIVVLVNESLRAQVPITEEEKAQFLLDIINSTKGRSPIPEFIRRLIMFIVNHILINVNPGLAFSIGENEIFNSGDFEKVQLKSIKSKIAKPLLPNAPPVAQAELPPLPVATGPLQDDCFNEANISKLEKGISAKKPDFNQAENKILQKIIKCLQQGKIPNEIPKFVTFLNNLKKFISGNSKYVDIEKDIDNFIAKNTSVDLSVVSVQEDSADIGDDCGDMFNKIRTIIEPIRQHSVLTSQEEIIKNNILNCVNHDKDGFITYVTGLPEEQQEFIANFFMLLLDEYRHTPNFFPVNFDINEFTKFTFDLRGL